MHGHGPHVFIDGGFFFGFGAPLYWDYGPSYFAPEDYLPPPPDVYPYYYPPPPPPSEEAAAPAEAAAPEEEGSPATYGLVQLRGVPDGTPVDLDGRFWLTAEQLDHRWLALPEGPHTIAIGSTDVPSAVRQFSVRSGTTLVVDFSSGD
jgi:hypothetical protein